MFTPIIEIPEKQKGSTKVSDEPKCNSTDPTEILLFDIAQREKSLEDVGIQMDKYSLAPWSFSKLKVLKQCPYNFYLKYILKIKRDYMPRNMDMANIGTTAHRILEHAMRGKSITESYSLTQKETYDKQMLTPEQWSNSIVTLEFSIGNFVDRIADFDKRTPIKRTLTELKMGITADYQSTSFFADNVYFRGIIDLGLQVEVKGSKLTDLLIIDHKHGGGEFSTSTKNYDTQLNLYKPMFHYGVEPLHGSQGGINFIRDGKLLWGNYSSQDKITTTHINDVEWILEGAVDKTVENGYFKHVMGSYCQWCDFQVECRLKNEKLRENEKSTKKYFTIKEIK